MRKLYISIAATFLFLIGWGLFVTRSCSPTDRPVHIHDIETKSIVVREPIPGMILEGIFYPVGSQLTSEENGQIILAHDTTPEYYIFAEVIYDSTSHIIKLQLK